MNVVIGSAFRNAAHYIPRYLNQVNRLRQYMGDDFIRIVAAEGDSVDNTRDLLRDAGAQIVECSHGGPIYGSTEAPERLKALSVIGNAIFGAVSDKDDVLVYVESDLIWTPATIATLIIHAMNQEQGFDVFAPLIFAGSHFYDIWGFRRKGVRFSPFPPFHADVNGHIAEVDSAGSCLVMRAEVARACRIRNDYCLVGWCEDARNQGFRVAVNPSLRVEHPA